MTAKVKMQLTGDDRAMAMELLTLGRRDAHDPEVNLLL
jgi:hypothetical protein